MNEQTTTAAGAAQDRREVSYDDELLILVDGDDNVVGHDTKLNVHKGRGQLHRAFSIFLISPCYRVLLQQRSEQKPLWPLYWSNSVCSHPRRGETCAEAAVRRLEEELSVTATLDYLYRFSYSAEFGSSGSERELCSVYGACIDKDYPIVANRNEVADWSWVTIEALEELIANEPERLTPWMKLEWARMQADDYALVNRIVSGAGTPVSASG